MQEEEPSQEAPRSISQAPAEITAPSVDPRVEPPVEPNVEPPVEPNVEPNVELIKHADMSGPRIGVFASSFNPVTIAHAELVRRAAVEFSLDEMLALAGRA